MVRQDLKLFCHSHFQKLKSESVPQFDSEMTERDCSFTDPRVIVSVNDDLESLYDRIICNWLEIDFNTENEYRQLFSFCLLSKSEKSNFLCSLTFDDTKSLGTYDGHPWGRWLDLNSPISSDVFKTLSSKLIFNISQPFYPAIPQPAHFHAKSTVNRKRLSENLLSKYPYLESSCDRFTFYLS